MIGPENANLLGFLGVSLLLVAFFLNLTKGLTKEHWKPFADQLDYDTLLPPKRNPPATSVSGGDH